MLIVFGRVLGIALASLLAASALEAATPNLQLIQKLVTEQKIGSVDELLSNLPNPLRSRYTLVFDSRSLQESSFRDPRVLLYGTTGKFILAFNGNAQHRGFDVVEMMEFDDSTQTFVLQELEFQRPSTNLRRAFFSDINPDKCSACHGKNPRPIWDTRPMWPGAYGEVYQEKPSPQESEGFAAFVRNQPTHVRYRYLNDVEGFAYRYRHRPSAKERYDNHQVDAPNGELSNLLGDLNLKSIAAMVVRHEAFELYKYALLATLTRNCTDIDDLFPSDIGPAVRASFRDFSDNSDLLNQHQQDRKRARLQQSPDRFGFASLAAIGEHDSLTRFRFVVETGLGVATEGWTLAFEKNSFDFTTRLPAVEQLERFVLREIWLNDRALTDLHSYGSQTSSQKHCSYLAGRSRDNLEQARAQGVRIQPAGPGPR